VSALGAFPSGGGAPGGFYGRFEKRAPGAVWRAPRPLLERAPSLARVAGDNWGQFDPPITDPKLARLGVTIVAKSGMGSRLIAIFDGGSMIVESE